jgi:hypothetical protein
MFILNAREDGNLGDTKFVDCQIRTDSSCEDLTVYSARNSGNNQNFNVLTTHVNDASYKSPAAKRTNKYENLSRLSLSETNDSSMLKRKLFEIIV